jgi:hypothetical protein
MEVDRVYKEYVWEREERVKDINEDMQMSKILISYE